MAKFQFVFWTIISNLLINNIIPIKSFQCYEDKFNQYYTVCTIYGIQEKSPTQFKVTSTYINPSSLQTIRICDSAINYIPLGIFDKSPYAKTLDVINSGIIEIGKYTFKNAQALQKLNLTRNNITDLEEGALPLNTLKIIDLSFNKIGSIHENTFQSQNVLEKLLLSNNEIKILSELTFNPLIALTYLDLTFNIIEDINHLFTETYNLVTLNVSSNFIKEIDGSTLIYTNHLKNFDISFNEIEILELRDTTVEFLSANGNQLKEIELGKACFSVEAPNNKISKIVTEYPEKIMGLNLSNNSITDLGIIANMTNLIKLNLSFNKLTLNITSFSLLQKLLILNLEATELSSIDYGTFSHQVNLTFLDISYNNLGTIDLSMFSSNNQLQSFYIDGNRLTDLSMDQFTEFFPKLKTIGISDNMWNCSSLAIIVKKLNTQLTTIFITNEKYVRSDSNIRGIFCVNEKNINKTIEFTKPNVHFQSDETVPFEEEIKLMELSLNESLTQNKVLQEQLTDAQKNSSAVIEQLKNDLDKLKKQISQKNINKIDSMETTLPTLPTQKAIETTPKLTTKVTTKTPNKNAGTSAQNTKSPLIPDQIDDEMKKLVEEHINKTLDEKIDKIMNTINENFHALGIFKDKSVEEKPTNKLYEDLRYYEYLIENNKKSLQDNNNIDNNNQNSVQHLSSIKILLVLIFITVVIFVVFKLTIFFFQKKKTYQHQHLIRSNTMTTLDEHNI